MGEEGTAMRTLLPALALLLGCPPGDKEDPELRWYTTCGDPACQAYTPEAHTNPPCESEAEGEICPAEGTGCDLQVDCNTELVCATEDPKAGEGGCPISLRAAKADIRYVDADARAALHDALVRVRLAEYRYAADADGKRHLGFLIDDQPAGSPAVLPSGERVDLYGYTSMAVAALQEQEARLAAQDRRIAAQEAELAALRERLAALEGRLSAP